MSAGPAQIALAIDGPPNPDLIRIRDLVYHAAGIFLPDSKLSLLSERCDRRVQELNLNSLCHYLNHLTNEATGQTELVALLNEITIGETCFFRSQPQLDAFREVALHKIADARRSLPTRPLRIWSAGCSTGEEPYTLGIILEEGSTELLGNWTFEIVATDLNDRSLDHARAATYDTYSTRHVTSYYKQKYFVQAGDQLQVQQSVRDCIRFRRVNLSDPADLIGMSDFDAIFCCNVLIYFDLASKRRVAQHFYRSLLPHGYLFLGRAESLFGVSNDFQLVHLPRATAYIRSDRNQQENQRP